MDDHADHWHLDKKVPIGIILALFAQFMGGIWFVSKLEARVLALETSRAAQSDRDNSQDAAQANSLGVLREDMREINRKLDRLIETRGSK